MFRKKRDLTGKRILITGVSSGIGRAIALQLARQNTTLLLTARRKELLTQLRAEVETQGSRAVVIAGDITDPSTRERIERIAREEGLDVLINNAGIGGLGTFASADESRLRQIMEVNFFAPVELIRCLLPSLRDSQDGVIVNIGSVLGHFAVPKKSEYCASKFAMHGFTDALRLELAAEGIDVLLVSPSTTSSQFFDVAMRSEGEPAANQNAMSPEEVARQTVRCIENRRREVILSVGGKLLVAANRLFPGWLSQLLQRFG